MTNRIDLTVRALAIGAGLAAIVASNSIAANESVSGPQRFLWLTVLGFVVLYAAAVGFDITSAYPKRRPLRLRWGKPSTKLGEPAPPPNGHSSHHPTPLVASLRAGPPAAVLAASVVVVLISATIGYALARTASSIGGLIIYLILATAIWSTGRAAVRLLARRAVRIDDDSVRMGWALGYWPPLTIARSAVEAFQERDGFVAIVAGTRRFELDERWFAGQDLIGRMSAAWPEVPWHRIPGSAVPLRMPWWDRTPPERQEGPAGSHDFKRREQP